MNLVAKLKTMLLALAGLSGLAFAATDYSSWASYRQVTVNTSTMSLSGNVTNIPILIRFNATDHADMLNNGATQILAGGADVRVTKADGITDVPFEIESATTGATGSLSIWVLADSVAQNSATAATFRVFWGKAGATTISNPAAVFTAANGFQAVFHLAETGGAGTAFTDAVSGLTTTTEGTAENTQNTLLGPNARTFGTGSGSGQTNNGVAVTNYAYFNPPVGHPLHAHTGPLTISAWGRTTLTSTGNRTAGDKHIIYHGQGNAGANHIYIKRWGATGTGDGAETAAGSNRIVAGGDTLVDSGGPYVGFGEAGTTVDHWAFYAGVWDGTNWTTHKMRRQNEWGIGSGGHPNASGGIGSLTHPDSYNSTTKPGNGAPVGTAGKAWFLGGWAADGDGAAATKNRGWHGQLDEVRIETVARSNDYMKLRFMVERGTVNAANPITVGATQVPPPGPYSAWSNSRNIKLNTSAAGANVTGNVTNFPVLVRLAANEAAILSAAKAGGADIRFSNSGGITALPYEIESWSGSAATIWVLVDEILGNNSTQYIKMYWGNPAANSESDGGAVFGSGNGFVGVWHMGNATGAAARPNAVPGGNPATPAASAGNLATGFIPVQGMVGMADTLRNLTNSATVADEDHFDLGATGYNTFQSTLEATMSMWLYLPSAWPGTDYVHFISLGTAANNNNLWMGRIGSTDNFATQSCNNTTCGSTRTATGALAPLGEWAHFAVRHHSTNGRQKSLYKNGVQVQTNTSNQNSNALTGTNVRGLNYIGRSVWGDRNLRGKVDEVRISDAARSPDWIKLSYESQKHVHTLTDIGAPPPVVPDAPVAVSAVAGTGQAFVSWSEPADDGRSAITGYTVTGTPSGTCSVGPTVRMCTISGLTNGTPYTFTATATNAVGTSAASAPSNSVTPTAVTTTNYGAWANNATLTLNTTSAGANVSGHVGDFPVLVRLTSAQAAVFAQAKAGGDDLRFSNAANENLPYEIDHWDAAGQSAAIWVKAKQVLGNTSGQALKMYWGNASAAAASSGSAVFDTTNGFAAVWHLGNAADTNARPNAITGAPAAVPMRFGTGYVTPKGVIGMADTLGGGNNSVGRYLDVNLDGNDSAYYADFSGGMSFSVWAYPTGVQKYARMFTLVGSNVLSNPPNDIALGRFDMSNTLRYELRTASASAGTVDNPEGLQLNEWQHYTVTQTGTAVTLYRNGVLVTGPQNITSAIVTAPRRRGYLGRTSWNDSLFKGMLDEAVLSRTARSASWVKLSYENQRAAQTLVTVPNLPFTGGTGPYASWTGHRSIVMNTSATGANMAGTVRDIPILIRLGSAEASIFSEARPGGADIRFSKANDSTPLPYQIETWEGTNAAIWVRVDTVLGNNNTQHIRMHWGNSSANSESNGPAVFGTANGYEAVFHLNEAAGDTVRDATANSYKGVPVGTAPTHVPGLSGTAKNFGGVADNITAGGAYKLKTAAGGNTNNSMDYIDSTDVLTMTAWVNIAAFPSSNANRKGIITKSQQFTGTTATGANQWNMRALNANQFNFARASGGAPAPVVTRADALNQWTFVTYIRSAVGVHNMRVYNQGGPATTAAATGADAPHAEVDVFIGAFAGAAGDSGTGVGFFSGLIDEVTVSNVARDTNWLALSFESQRPNQVFTNIGVVTAPAATVPGAPTGVTGTPSTTTTGSIVVTWTAPASNGGAAITAYNVTGAPGGSCATTGALTCTVTGLTGGGLYTFTVTATNSVGIGAASAASPAVQAPVSILPGSFVIRMDAAGKPFTYRIPAAAVATTEALTMTISDIHGRKIWTKTINPAESKLTELSWNGRTSNGVQVSAGMYVVRIAVKINGETVETVQKGVTLKP